jgi:putative endonuclease
MAFYVYILECSNNSFYVGYTTDLNRRYQQHCQGTPECKYTRSFPPRRLAACWHILGSKSAAMQIEKKLKQIPKSKKLALVAKPETLQDIFSEHALETLDPQQVLQ